MPRIKKIKKQETETKPEDKNIVSEQKKDIEYACPYCNAYFKISTHLANHTKITHGRGSDSAESMAGELNLGDTNEDAFKLILKKAGVKGGLEDLIAQLFFLKDSTNIYVLNDILTQAVVPPNRKKMIISAWSMSQGIPVPEDIMSELDRSSQGIFEQKKPAEKTQEEGIFDFSEMEKSMKQMFKMQQYNAMMDFFRNLNHQNTPTMPTTTQTRQVPMIDPNTGQMKIVETQGSMDPMAMMFMFMMQQQNKDPLAELIKLQKATKIMGNDGSRDRDIHDLRLQMVQNNAEREKAAIEEKSKLEKWLTEFKNVLEKSKLETEFNSKLDKIQEQLKDARNKGDMMAELNKYHELKKVLTTFAETEGMKKGEGERSSGIDWQNLLGKGLDAMNSYLKAQENAMPQMVPVRDIPPGPMPSEEELRRQLVEQEDKQHGEFDFENYFGGVTYNPNMGTTRPDELPDKDKKPEGNM